VAQTDGIDRERRDPIAKKRVPIRLGAQLLSRPVRGAGKVGRETSEDGSWSGEPAPRRYLWVEPQNSEPPRGLEQWLDTGHAIENQANISSFLYSYRFRCWSWHARKLISSAIGSGRVSRDWAPTIGQPGPDALRPTDRQVVPTHQASGPA